MKQITQKQTHRVLGVFNVSGGLEEWRSSMRVAPADICQSGMWQPPTTTTTRFVMNGQQRGQLYCWLALNLIFKCNVENRLAWGMKSTQSRTRIQAWSPGGHLRAASPPRNERPALLLLLFLRFNKKQQRELTSSLTGGGNWSGRGRVQGGRYSSFEAQQSLSCHISVNQPRATNRARQTKGPPVGPGGYFSHAALTTGETGFT